MDIKNGVLNKLINLTYLCFHSIENWLFNWICGTGL